MASFYGKRRTSEEMRDLLDEMSSASSEVKLDFSDDDESDLEQAQDNFDGDFSDVDDAETADEVQLDDLIANVDANIEAENESNVEENEGESTGADDEGEVTWYSSQNKNNTRKWSNRPPKFGKIPNFQILREVHGLTPFAKSINLNKPVDCFKAVITEPLMNVIVAETNRKAKDYYDSRRNPQQAKAPRLWYDTNSEELYALLAILIHAGMRKNWDERLEELWDKDSRPFYRATMSLQRTQQLLRFMRFDNYRTRVERLKTDKFAAFRDIWEMFLKNVKALYRPSANLTIDEQLVATRGRCNFRQYMPSKPGKYGIKIFWICDALNSYPLKAEVYIGRQPNQPVTKDYTLNLVHRLADPYTRKGRTLFMDNFFTSCALAEQMIQKLTTIVGTIKKNKPDLPAEFAGKNVAKTRKLNSSQFCFNGNLTLVSFVPQPNRNVLLLSTLHNTDAVDQETGKPKIILDYNSNKGGVDTMDKLVKTYTCKRKTRRWPMVLFFNMIDAAALAAYKIHKLSCQQLYVNSVGNERKLFLKSLSEELADSHIRKRLANPSALKRGVKMSMQILGYDVSTLRRQPQPQPQPSTSGRRKSRRCHLCQRNQDIKTQIVCHFCDEPVCKRHYKTVCENCIRIEIEDVEVIAHGDDDDVSP